MNLSVLERDSSSLTTSQAKRISDSIEMVTCCTSEIRTISYLLHPPLLDEMGLPAALAAYSDGFAERSGIRVELDITKGFERLPTDSETGLFRIVQQSLANIHRHSGSCVAKVTIRQDAEAVSYTHLDVYKRQVLSCTSKESLSHVALQDGSDPCPKRCAEPPF